MKTKGFVVVLGIAVLILSALLFSERNEELVVFKTALDEVDMQVENLVLVSDGREVYLPANLAFRNISSQNIENVKFFIRKGDALLLDLIFQMDELTTYVWDMDRRIEDVGIASGDVLTIDLEYVLSGEAKRVTREVTVP